VFIAWIEANLGPRPEGMRLDRWPDNDGDYSPGNVRWATWSQQLRHAGTSVPGGHPVCAGQRLDLAAAGLRPRLGSLRRRARNAATAAAIAANPDMPVPTAAMSVHPESPPELAATAYTVVVGAAGVGLLAAAATGSCPMAGDGEPIGAAEYAPFRSVTVTVTVTTAGLTGVNATDSAGNRVWYVPDGFGFSAVACGRTDGPEAR